MKKIFLLSFVTFSLLKLAAQNHVGINTINPLAALHVADSSVLFSAEGDVPLNAGNTPVSGPGRRMMWYPDKAAFRVGYATGYEWDSASIGKYSFAAGRGANAIGTSCFALGDNAIAFGANAVAIGRKTIASASGIAIGDSAKALGLYSLAMGFGSKALGNSSIALGEGSNASAAYSTALGPSSTASGNSSTAMGLSTTASNSSSTAMGFQTAASGIISTAMGINTVASGDYAIAMGEQTTASGGTSIAIGNFTIASGAVSFATGRRTIASGLLSTAMGVQASTNGHTNSFCISGVSDNTVNPTTVNTLNNQMMMRFDNYTFWVSSSNYAYLIPASNGWAYTSDVNKKERFEELNGDTVLKKIAAIPFYSWNFKAADTKQYRHYGIMAQDFYGAFGNDSYGAIGNDTTVSPLDLLGVAYSGIKALEKRSTELAKENEQLKADNLALQKDNLLLQNDMTEIKKQFVKTNDQLADKMTLLEMKINEVTAGKEKTDAPKIVVINK